MRDEIYDQRLKDLQCELETWRIDVMRNLSANVLDDVFVIRHNKRDFEVVPIEKVATGNWAQTIVDNPIIGRGYVVSKNMSGAIVCWKKAQADE